MSGKTGINSSLSGNGCIRRTLFARRGVSKVLKYPGECRIMFRSSWWFRLTYGSQFHGGLDCRVRKVPLSIAMSKRLLEHCSVFRIRFMFI